MVPANPPHSPGKASSAPPGGVVSAALPAQQARSRQTLERIVAAAVDLLGEKAFDDLSVAEIARRAGLSVGGFYARFDGKMALLHYLQGAVLGGLLEKAREIFSPEATASLARAGLRCLDGPMARCGP